MNHNELQNMLTAARAGEAKIPHAESDFKNQNISWSNQIKIMICCCMMNFLDITVRTILSDVLQEAGGCQSRLVQLGKTNFPKLYEPSEISDKSQIENTRTISLTCVDMRPRDGTHGTHVKTIDNR